MLPSRFQSEVLSVCEAGLESYLANKHKEYRNKRIEEGAFGAFVGVLGILGISYMIKDSGVKPSYVVFPIGAAMIVSGADAILNADKLDEEYTEEFNDVCDNDNE